MSLSNPSGKAQKDRLVELEEQMLYLVEVPDSIRYLESRLDEISEKTNMIDAVACRVEDSSTGSAAHIKERVEELDSSQKTLLEMINGMLEDYRATLDVVRNEIVYVNARLSLIMRAMANQAPAGGAILVSRVKIPEPKPFCGVKDAKALENYIFDLEQYFRATNTFTKEAKEGRCTIDTWDALKRELRSEFFPENVEILARRKLRELKHTGLKPWAKTKLYEQRVQDLTSAYAADERLFDLSNDSQDTRRHPSSSSGGSRNNCPSSPKTTGGDKRLMEIGPHMARECPKKTAFNAFQASLASDSDNQQSQTEKEVDQTEEVDNPRIGTLKFLSSLQKKVGETNTPVERDLMYVDTWINQKPTKSTMVDSGATHNFITEAEAKRLDLRWMNESCEFCCPTYHRTTETNDDKIGRMK
ncbi:uncharacterized protein E5676_scaffold688G00220 [Cucumis melo var. makuwa]|uniref:Retrotransposon gag domain-containing protein n=1 Tax=Cucumis melo var. makuwa TaxID=1194695 RepID=A0A5D3CRF6_CUCMM|nr:uncharacterized protein E6C27_scaffold376G00690 [Cucumis melo var. makuwa]TYK14165.1 uncharacterized protein E5676_scaffold688G00220 [Cucumis melo var. makuwa]